MTGKKRILSAALASVMAVSMLPAVEADALQSSGTAPFINTWMVAGPSDTPTAEQIYNGQSGGGITRPADGNWASLAKASATTEWPESPGITFAAENAVDGDMGTDWASRSNSEDEAPALTLTWPEAVKVKTIRFYDRHDPEWADAENVSNVEKVICTLKNSAGETLAEKTAEGGIDPTGKEPGVIEFDSAVTDVASAELRIVYDTADKSNKTLSLGFKEVEVYDGDPIGDENEPVPPENTEELEIASVAGGSTYGSDVAENAIDGDLTTAWKSNTVQGVIWEDFSFTVELAEISTVTSMKFTAFERSEILDFSVSYEMYDSDGMLVGSGEVDDVTGAMEDEKNVAFSDVYGGAWYNVKTVKLSFIAPEADSDNDRFGFREIEFTGAPGETEIPEDPNRVKITPVLGEEFGESGTKWQYFDDRIYNRNTDDYNDFYGYFQIKQGVDTEDKYIYAHTYVYSEKKQNAQFNFTAMGPHRLWVNDRPASQSESIGNVNDKENYKVSCTLEEGWNKILLQIRHSGKPYVGLYARLCDESGNALEGLTCSVLGPTADELTVATRGLDIDRAAFEERNADIPANEYPDGVLPRGYTEWPYVWNESTGSAWYGPDASRFQLQAAGGVPGYTWKLVEGELPDGLTLNEDGTIDGFCGTETGTFEFTVQVTDSEGNIAEKELEIEVKERPNQWFEEGGASALSHCASAYPAYFDSNYSVDLWAERVKDQGITMISVECKQGPYWWPGPLSESCAEQHAPEVRYQDEEGKWHIKDMVMPFKEAADRHGLRFGVYYGSNGGWQFGHDGAYDMVDIEDLIVRYDPWYIFFDGSPQNTDNVEVRWSMVRSYNDRILIQANDQREASDNDLNILEQRYYFDTPYLYGGYWEQNMLPQNKKTVIECWNGPYVRYFHGENAQTGLDWRLACKAFVTSIGQGYVWNWDQETSAIRGYREWYYNYAPDIPDIYNINAMFNQDMITIRNQIVDWFAPEGKPDKRESLFGTTSYIFDYGMQDNYTQEYRSDLAIKYGEGPEWGYTRRRDNTFYMHMVETHTKDNELINHVDRIKDKTGFTGQDSMEAGPFDYEVTSVEWLNEGQALNFESYEKDGKYYASVDTSDVTADPIDTILKIKTADPERTYRLTGVKTYSSQPDLNTLQLRTEANLNDFASVIIPADITFESSDPSVAEVDENGLVTKTGNGEALIRVTAEYEGETAADTYPVIADDQGIRPNLELIGVVMFTGEQEVQGAVTPFDHPEVTFQGRTEKGGGIDLPFVAEEDITYHYATVDDHAVTTEIPEAESIFTVEDGVLNFRDRVSEKTNLAYWADVTIGGETYTTNKMFLWVYPDGDLSRDIIPEASSSQEDAGYTTDDVSQDPDGVNDRIWTPAADDADPSLTYDLGVTARLSGIEIYYNGSYWGYDNMPKQVKVEVSDDGEEWRTALEAVDAPANRSNYHFDDPNTYSFQETGRYVRVTFPGGAQEDQLDILEVNILGLDYSQVLASMEIEPVISQDGKTAEVNVTAYTGTGEAADLSDAKITVESEDENIAAVSENGIITGTGAGKAKISVTVTRGADTIEDYFYLTVNDDLTLAAEDFLKEVVLEMNNTAVDAEHPAVPDVRGQMGSGEEADLSEAEITYNLSDERLVYEDGKIILAEGAEPGFTAEVSVTVTLDGITVESQSVKMVCANTENIGKTAEITVSSTYSDEFKPEFLVDGDKSTCWACQGTVDGSGNIKPWFEMDLGGVYEITKINLIERGLDVGRIQEGLLEWEGGSMLLEDIKWEGQPDNVFEFEEPIKTSWLKFTIDPSNTCTAETNHRGLAEFQVYGVPAEVEVPTDPEEPSAARELLQKTYDRVKDLSTEGVVDSAVKAFEEALANAKDILENRPDATDEEMLEAWNRLVDATHGLGLLKGDKSILEVLVSQAEEMITNADRYVVENWPQLEEALAEAKAVLEDNDAMDDTIRPAEDKLLDAILAQRYKADKDNLQALIDKANAIDLSQYTEASVSVFKAALKTANAVLADENLSQDDQAVVDSAVKELDAAISGLVKTSDGDNTGDGNTGDTGGGNTGSSGNDSNTGAGGGSNGDNAGTKDDSSRSDAPKTGDHADVFLWGAVMTAALAGVLAVFVTGRRRRKV